MGYETRISSSKSNKKNHKVPSITDPMLKVKIGKKNLNPWDQYNSTKSNLKKFMKYNSQTT